MMVQSENGSEDYSNVTAGPPVFPLKVKSVEDMISDYAYVVTADIRYLPEVVANLNSLDYIGNEQDVHFIGYDIPQEVLEQFPSLGYTVHHHAITKEEIEASHGLSEVVCRKRYWYAAKYGEAYSAVCILDADMVWSHLPDVFFEIAAKTGLVVGASKEQNKTYADPHHMYGCYGGRWVMPEGFHNPHDLCNAPTFLDTNLWEPALEKQWEIFVNGFPETNFKAPDMDAMNLCFAEHGGVDRMLPLPGMMFLGTNEQHLKPYIRATMREDGLWTESGVKIYSIHGHYFHKIWRETQVENRRKCNTDTLNGSESANSYAEQALETLHKYAEEMLWGGTIQIERKNYRHPERPYGE